MFLPFLQKKTPLQAGKLQEKNFSFTTPFTLKGGLLFIDVQIDERTYKFLFDTGAMSVIPTSLVHKLQLSPLKESICTVDADGVEKHSLLYTLPTLHFGELTFTNFTTIADDFSEHFPLCCFHFHGIFGYNFLQNLTLKIDYEKKLLTLTDRAINTTSYIKTPLRFAKNGVAEFAFSIAKKKLWVALDTGKNDGIMTGEKKFKELFTKEAYKQQRTTGLISSSFHGLNEHSFVETYLLKDFSIANKISIDSFPCSYEKNSLNSVGNEFLRNFHIAVDFKKKHLHLKPLHKEPIKEVFTNPFGFSMFWNEEQKLYIASITQDTPAYNSKLKIGDKIMSINDFDTLNLEKEEYCHYAFFYEHTMFYKREAKSLDIILKREGRLIRETLTLEQTSPSL